MAVNTLYYGDNPDILRRYVKDETVDLVYLDPPFNSNATYNVLFKEEAGPESTAQIKAFEDTWVWDKGAAEAYEDVVTAGGHPSDALQAFRTLLGPSTMLAYLAMMAPRLIELRRVLKPTGSIYLHCDPTASHYLKLLMDAIFGPENFRNEIYWVRTNAHNFRSRHFAKTCDILLFYTKSEGYIWNPAYGEYTDEQMSRYKVEEETGRLYKAENLTFTGKSPTRNFEWRGVRPPKNRVWGYAEEKLEALWAEGRILARQDGAPRLDGLKVYLDETKGGKALSTVWDDIPRIGNTDKERLGYPTQKPQALLERIINASSNPDDLVLDPFCGCGTAVAAAQALGRRWIGIDITHIAVTLMKQRLWDSFGRDLPFTVIGEPTTVEDAATLAHAEPYQFQLWSLGLVGARPVEVKKGADKGIDGRLIFIDDAKDKAKQVIISVKAGGVNVAQVRDLNGVLTREKAEIGVLISLEEPTRPMRTEAADAGFYDSPWGTKHPRLQLLTIAELLAGKEISYPHRAGNITYKKAPKAGIFGAQLLLEAGPEYQATPNDEEGE